MIDPAGIANTIGVFPNVEAVNSSTGSSLDGTPLLANIRDDIWGYQQAVLNAVGATPSGSVETSSTSQILDSQKKLFGVTGEVVWWQAADGSGGVKDPATMTLPPRLLLLNGQGILRANYTDLDATCYVGNTNNAAVAAAGGGYYRADDAAGTAPNISGIYLILPDCRGYAIRGSDPLGTTDKDGARYVGEPQSDSIKEHRHDALYFNIVDTELFGNTTAIQNGTGAFTNVESLTTGGGGQSLYVEPSFTGSNANETVMKNMAGGLLAVRY
jgi:hypothetical protein